MIGSILSGISLQSLLYLADDVVVGCAGRPILPHVKARETNLKRLVHGENSSRCGSASARGGCRIAGLVAALVHVPGSTVSGEA
jgi:hypothetical protein